MLKALEKLDEHATRGARMKERDHALRAYQLDTGGPPFSSLTTCVPSSVYALAALQERPAWLPIAPQPSHR